MKIPLISRWFGAKIETPAPSTDAQRDFESANVGRLNSDFVPSAIRTNWDMLLKLPQIIMRSRELGKNDEYTQSYLKLLEDNVVGPDGFQLRLPIRNDDKARTLDRFAIGVIMREWDAWGKPVNKAVTLDGTMGVDELDNLIIRTLALDGAAIIRVIYGASNAWNISFQLLDTMDLDLMYTVQYMENGHRILMGVELDADDRPVAYWIRKNEGSPSYYSGPRERIPADEIINLFWREFAGQIRGIPWLNTVILKLWQLHKYSEAELVASRVAACQMGILERDATQRMPGALGEKSQKADPTPPPITMEPGVIRAIPEGWKHKDVKPEHPAGNFAIYLKAILRSIARAVNVAYHSLSGDLESVNFSSARAGELKERDGWKKLQNFMIRNWKEFQFYHFLRASMLSGKIPLPYSKLSKFNCPQFIGRRWGWVDPLKDITAAIAAVENHLSAPQEFIIETGRDPRQVLDDIQEWEAMKKERGITGIDGTVDGGTDKKQLTPEILNKLMALLEKEQSNEDKQDE